MKLYKSHKIVAAAKILEVFQDNRHNGLLHLEWETQHLQVSREYMNKHDPKAGGYSIFIK